MTPPPGGGNLLLNAIAAAVIGGTSLFDGRLAIEAGLAAVKDWESEPGELTGDELAAAREILDRLGDGRDLGA